MELVNPADFKKSDSMLPVVKKDILALLIDVSNAIRKHNFYDIKEISNHTIHNASIYQDADSISVAVAAYALSKIIERDAEGICPKVEPLLLEAIEYLEKDLLEKYRASIKGLIAKISSFDSRLKLYVQEVISRAQIKKASSMYYHGISLARVSELLGISQWELMSYVGNTTIHDDTPESLSPKSRLSDAFHLFNLEG